MDPKYFQKYDDALAPQFAFRRTFLLRILKPKVEDNFMKQARLHQQQMRGDDSDSQASGDLESDDEKSDDDDKPL